MGRDKETDKRDSKKQRKRERETERDTEREMLQVRTVVGLWLEGLILCYSTITKE